MPLPKDIRVIDTLLDLPREDRPLTERFSQLRDEGSVSGALKTPAGYMFKEPPEARSPQSGDPVGDTLREMDEHNIETAVFNLSSLACTEAERTAIRHHSKRFRPVLPVDPNRGMDAIRDITRAHAEVGIVGVALFPVGYVPPVPINDKRMYPIYVKCIELDIAVFCTSGVPGPRLPFDAQYTGLVDEVCWFFPELRFILRHGCEPWTDLAVKLLLKWPNLYYSTSAFAPKYYPKEIVEFANTRGADKILYAGYYPLGLTLERIFRELEDVPFRDHVWPKFLRENAIKALKIDL
jgi:predicted TIM-barrel fold metal-dependent hydrolase